jgi:hypothetical protein
MSEKIEINVFSRESIMRAKAQLQKKADKLDYGTRRAVESLTQTGYEYMMSIVPSESGDLAGSISWDYDAEKNVGRIRVNSDYAIFVEYGTGIVGAANPHPNPALGWTYDFNGHGEKGWNYYDAKQGKFRWTRGEAPSAFVFRTKEYMQQIADNKLKVSVGK